MNTMTRTKHAVYDLNYHLILVTKYRRQCLYGELETDVKNECSRLVREMGGKVLEIESDKDHLHILMSLKPSTSISAAVRILKSTTARLMRQKHPDHLRRFYWKDGTSIWSDSYFAATAGGVTLEMLQEYVAGQKSEAHQRK